jgi:hypothetical protein
MSKQKKRLSPKKILPAEAMREDSPSYRSNGAEEDAKLRFIDLFCGIGGFRIAFEKAGCECVFSSDWNNYAQIAAKMDELAY